MLVSLYMSVKNGHPYIRDAIKSIKAQTWNEWEVVIVDDGSSDNTPDYLKKIESEDPRFRVILTDGIGRSKALNLAIDSTNGEFIANIDADDLFHPQKIEKQVNVFKQNPGVDFLCTGTVIFFDNIGVDWKSICEISGGTLVVKITNVLLKGNPVNHSSVMMRKSLFAVTGGYNESLTKLVDYDLWCRLCLAGKDIFKLNDKLVGKRIHNGQSYENKKRIAYIMSAYEMQMHFIHDMNASLKYKILAFLKLIYGFFPQQMRIILKCFVK